MLIPSRIAIPIFAIHKFFIKLKVLLLDHLGFGTGLDGFSSSDSSSSASNTSHTVEILFINLVAIFSIMFLGKIYDFNFVDNRVSCGGCMHLPTTPSPQGLDCPS